MFRAATIQDASIIAKMHCTELSGEFLPSLGQIFLQTLYMDMLKQPTIVSSVFVQKNDIEGFIIGSKDFAKDFNTILKKKFFKYSFLLFKQIVKAPIIIKNIMQTLFYTKIEGPGVPKAELVIIVVLKAYQYEGIGKKLVFQFEKKLKDGRIHSYRLSVNAKNKKAILFYEALGLKRHSVFSLYGKQFFLYTKIL